MRVYATTNDMIVQFRAQLLGQLASDTPGTPVPPGSLPTNTRLATAVEMASGDINKALTTQNRYSPSVLVNFTAADAVTGSGPDALLKRICCDLALERLYATAGSGVPDDHAKLAKTAKYDLERLNTGKDTLDVAANRDAGVMDTTFTTAQDLHALGSLSANGVFPPLTNVTVTGAP